MALGFIKKVFSFGRKQVEETPTEDEASQGQPAAGPDADVQRPREAKAPVEGPVPEFLRRPEVETEDAPADEIAVEPSIPAQPDEPAAQPLTPEPAAQPEPDGPTEQEAAIARDQAAPEPVGGNSEVACGDDAAVELPIPPDAGSVSGPAPDVDEHADDDGVPVIRDADFAERGSKGLDSEAASPLAVPEPEPEPEPRVEAVSAAPVTVAAEPRKPWFQRLREGLSRSSRELSSSISGIFTRRKLDEDTLQDLEDVLIRADLGVETAMRITDSLSSARYGKDVSDAEVRAIMASEVEKVLTPVALPLELDLSHKPHVILVVGVNGTGKTTTIGKLAAKLTEGGLSVTLAAGDTFRAAAIEQLKIWGERTRSPVIASKLGADAAGLAFDAYEKAKSAGSDVLIIDTAGRLQNKAELMAELEKIVRVLGKHDAEAPHTVLQTVDATTGQNALNQVEIFKNVAGVNGIVMTKLDGTARGGILVAIAAKHKLPVYFIGVGEGVDDLEPFAASDFAKAIAGVAE